MQLLAQLLTDRWLDDRTRMVTVDFNLYNSNTNLLTVCRFILEYLPTGMVLNSYWLYSMQLLLYETVPQRLRGCGEVIIIMGCFYYLFKEIQQVGEHGKCTCARPVLETAAPPHPNTTSYRVPSAPHTRVQPSLCIKAA